MSPSDSFRENLTCRIKHNHELLVRIDDELKRLQERRADLEEQNHLLFAVLTNSGEQVKAPRMTTNVRSEFVLLLGLMILVLALLYLGFWAPLLITSVGTLCTVIALQRRRKRTMSVAHSNF
jgi:Flp pilus assembly protein TadB